MNWGRYTFLAVFLCLLPSLLALDRPEPSAAPVKATPAVVAEFLAAMPLSLDRDALLKLMEERLWDVYATPNVSREELEAYVKTASDGPGLAYAAFALVSFHHPNSATIILERALDKEISNDTRWFLLPAGLRVLSPGGRWPSFDGTLERAQGMARGFMEYATLAKEKSVGNMYALILDYPYRKYGGRKPGSYLTTIGIEFYSVSLIGTLDLRDHALLEPRLDPRDERVFLNVMTALSYAMNRDYVKELRYKEFEEFPPEFPNEVAQHAQRTWAEYLQAHPDGDWKPAAIEGFALAGYHVTTDIHEKETRQELKRVLEGQDTILQYNACRLLNDFYGTHYDLERIFFGAKKDVSKFFAPVSADSADYRKLLDLWKVELSK